MSLHISGAATLARTRAEETEYGRRLTVGVATAVTDAGFPRHFVPKHRGGEAGSFTEAAEAAAALGEACTSTAWCAALYAAHARLAGYLPEAGQAEVWADGPDVRIAAAIVPPAGEATAAPDGWLLSGTWHLASGVDHAHWILLAAPAGTGGERAPRIFAVPRIDFRVSDTWRSLGLRGTGSNTVHTDRVFVPAHRSMGFDRLAHVEPGRDRCHAVPPLMVGGAQFAAPVLGAARQALRDWHALNAARVRPDGTSAADAPARQRASARASADIHAAELLLRHALHRADHGETTPLAVAENVRDFARAAQLCAEAVDLLMRTGGSRALAEDSPLQRRWRDITAAAGHAALDFEAASSQYARALAEAAGDVAAGDGAGGDGAGR